METLLEPMKSLPEYVVQVVKLASKPLAFTALKKELAKVGVSIKGKSKVSDASIQSAIDSGMEQGTVFEHAAKKAGGKPAYWHTGLPTAAEIAAEKARENQAKAAEKAREKQAKADAKANKKLEELELAQQEKAKQISLRLRRAVDDRGDELFTSKQLGEPESAASEAEKSAFATTLETLIAEGKLFRHGAKFGKHAPIVPRWYHSPSVNKPFNAATKAIRAILDSSNASLDEILKALRESASDIPLPAKPKLTPPVAEVAPASAAELDLRTELQKAYEYLCQFVEFQHRRVEIRAIFHQIKKRMPGISVADFHRELLAMSKAWIIELHDLNEVREAEERELAIDHNGRLLYYVIWK